MSAQRFHAVVVVLQGGGAQVCLAADAQPRSAACVCASLSRPGETATVTPTCASNTGVGGANGWTFAEETGGDSSLLTRTAHAETSRRTAGGDRDRGFSCPGSGGFAGGAGGGSFSANPPAPVSPH